MVSIMLQLGTSMYFCKTPNKCIIFKHNLSNNLCFKSILGFGKTYHTEIFISTKQIVLHALKICRLLNFKMDIVFRIVTSLQLLWMTFDVSSVCFFSFDGFGIDKKVRFIFSNFFLLYILLYACLILN